VKELNNQAQVMSKKLPTVFFSEAKDLLNDDLSERSKTSIN